MLLKLDTYKNKKLRDLAEQLYLSNDAQTETVIVEKMKKVVSSDSINDIEKICEKELNVQVKEVEEVLMKKATELAELYVPNKPDGNVDELTRRFFIDVLYRGLIAVNQGRIRHCFQNDLEFTPHYPKILTACYKKNGYCPCKIPYPDTYCPCVENLDEISKDGHCHCNMFKR